ncbi:MAG: hypothetical protein KAJ58_02435 [Candidatus Pacebacteria bacterium]|nr:hypothetical protein [Candidatus Paceibacterota bacterium]
MLSFAINWSWQLKTGVSLLGLILMLICMPVLERQGLTPDSYFIFWFLGCFLSMLVMASISSIPLIRYVTPFKACLFIFCLGLVIGGPSNILLVQAMSTVGEKAVSNPAIPFAVVGVGNSLVYIFSWICGKMFPTVFPAFPFSWVQFGGLLLLFVGSAMLFLKK